MADKVSTTRFNYAPTIKKGRTRFDLSHNVLTSFNTGDFVPVLIEPVYPGETFTLNTASLARLETSIHQTMDNAYLEFAFFFVPNRIIYDDFDKFLGANDDPWAQTQQFAIPQINLKDVNGQHFVVPQSLLNQLGVPSGYYGSNNGTGEHFSISVLPLRALFQVWNDWYRNENLDSIIYFAKDGNDVDLHTTYLLNGANFDPSSTTLKVNRFHDLYSTCLPAPQKGPDTTLGLDGYLPVIAGNSHPVENVGMTFVSSSDGSALTGSYQLGIDGSALTRLSGSGSNINAYPTPNNLYAKADSLNITVNQLRLAIVSQAVSELKARGGTRYKEILYSTWSVQAPDLILDRAEFLGGKRIPVNMLEVLQTSETGTTVLGTDAGHSKTLDSSESFIKSFSQHGWIVGVAYCRTSRSYSQGIDRKLCDKDYYDLYQPLLDNIGEVGVKKKELYALKSYDNATVATGESIFGYQEAWYHLKERSNQIRGYFQTGITGTMDSWHYGDSYTDYPALSASWLKEGTSNVDRTIAVQSSVGYQWTLSVHFELFATREMNKYSIPNTFGFGF